MTLEASGKNGPTWQWIAAILLAIAGAFGTIVLNNIFGSEDKIVQLQIDMNSIKQDVGYLRKEFDTWKVTK